MSEPGPAGGDAAALSFATPRLRAEPAGPGEAAALQSVLDAVPGYRLLEEAPEGPEAGAGLLGDAEADPDRRLLLLRFAGGGAAAGSPPAGILDLQLHWPEPGAAHIRLLLVREALQGRGLGREVVAALAGALRLEGLRALRLSVTDENQGARLFWERMGFVPVDRLDEGVTVLEMLL